jgi:hypothetical protein
MPYRDPRQALEERLRALEQERAELQAELAHQDAVRERARRVDADLAELRDLAGGKLSLPVLQMATPCKARWEDMEGDDHVRFCTECRKNVYDLTTLSELETALLVRQKEGRFCGRMAIRRDGTAIADDCPVGVRRRRRTTVAVIALAATATTAMTMTKVGAVEAPRQVRRAQLDEARPAKPEPRLGDRRR